MILETIEVGGCRSYLLGCEQTFIAALIDPEISAIERYRGLAARHGMTVRYVIDTHTHADHFSGAREISRLLGAQVVMSHLSPAPYVDLRLGDGDMLLVGSLRVQAMATPGHTADSTCYVVQDHVFTGDTLLIGGTGRSDLPTGDPEQLCESLFTRLSRLPDGKITSTPRRPLVPARDLWHYPSTSGPGTRMKLRLAIAALVALPALSACTTDELALFDTALSLYSDIEYLDGDCAFGLHRYYDRDGHHHCSISDDEYHQDGNGHHHDQN